MCFVPEVNVTAQKLNGGNTENKDIYTWRCFLYCGSPPEKDGFPRLDAKHDIEAAAPPTISTAHVCHGPAVEWSCTNSKVEH